MKKFLLMLILILGIIGCGKEKGIEYYKELIPVTDEMTENCKKEILKKYSLKDDSDNYISNAIIFLKYKKLEELRAIEAKKDGDKSSYKFFKKSIEKFEKLYENAIKNFENKKQKKKSYEDPYEAIEKYNNPMPISEI